MICTALHPIRNRDDVGKQVLLLPKIKSLFGVVRLKGMKGSTVARGGSQGLMS